MHVPAGSILGESYAPDIDPVELRGGLGSKKWGPKVKQAGEICCQLEKRHPNKKNSRGGEKVQGGLKSFFGP